MPADPAQMQALNEHERNKKVSDLPAFFGQTGKDTVTAKQLIQRIEKAAAVCNWNDAQKALQLSCCFKGSALVWYEGLEKAHGLQTDDWDVLKKAFLAQYEGLVTSVNITLSIKDLQQRSGERVIDYTTRGQGVFNQCYDKIMATWTDTTKVPEANDGNRDACKASMKVAARGALMTLQMIMFEAGLQDHLRLDVSQKEHATLWELQQATLLAEARHTKTRKLQVAAIEEEDKPEEEEEADEATSVELEEDQYKEVAAVYAKEGRRMPSFYKMKKRFSAPRKNQGNGSQAEKKPLECWHCGKKGHGIADCYSRKAGRPKTQGTGGKVSEVEAQISNVNIETLNY